MRMQGITQAVGRLALHAKQQSPHIFFIAGTASVVTGGVLACKATLSVETTLDEIKDNLDAVKEARATPGTELAEVTEHEYRGVVAKTHLNSALKLGRLYGPAVLITGVGIACLAGSHIQLTRRNAALQATLVAVQTAYDNYRERIREEIGEERENAIFRNIDGIAEKDAPDGRDPNRFSVYARIFDETNPNYSQIPEENRIFLKMQENYANHLLNSRQHLFLNEVLDALGFEHTQAGSVVGWIMDKKGDATYVDFGLHEMRNANFINGVERNVWLDFPNVKVIFDQI